MNDDLAVTTRGDPLDETKSASQRLLEEEWSVLPARRVGLLSADVSLSALERFSYTLLHYHFISMPFIAICLSVDAITVIMAFTQSPVYDGTSANVVAMTHSTVDSFFTIMTVLSFVGIILAALSFGVVYPAISMVTLVHIVTYFYQIVLFIINVVGDLDTTRFYVPFFLRIWVLQYNMTAFLEIMSTKWYSPKLLVIIRVSQPFLNVAAVILSAAKIFQLVDARDKEESLTMIESLYFVVVTFTTVGYGEILPQDHVARFVVMAFIFASVIQVPRFISTIEFLLSVWSRFHSYSSTLPHIVVCGRLNERDMSAMISEIQVLDPRMKVVFVSEEPFSHECEKLLRRPGFRQSAVLIEGDISRLDLMERCKIRGARAVFVISDKSTVSCRGDTKALWQGIALRKHEPTVPLLMWMKFGTHSFLSTETTIIHRERFKRVLLAVGAVLPGVIPFVCNLILTPNKKRHELGELDNVDPSDWEKLYSYSRHNQIEGIEVSDQLVGCQFTDAAKLVHRKYNVILLALVRDGNLFLNPSTAMLEKKDLLLAIAHIGESLVFDFSTEELASSPSANVFAPSFQGTFDATLLTELPQLAESPARVRDEEALHKERERTTEHFLLVDVPAGQDGSSFTENEVHMNGELQTRLLLLMMQSIKSVHRRSQITLLSPAPVSEDVMALWKRSGLSRVRHVVGSGLSTADVATTLLRDLQITGTYRTKGVVIFSSHLGEHRSDAAMFAAYTSVRKVLSSKGRCLNYEANLTLELRDAHTSSIVGPFHSDKDLNRRGEDKYYFSLPYMMGKVFSTSMLQPIMVHACRVPEILPLFEHLLNVPVHFWRTNNFNDPTSANCGGMRPVRFRVYSNRRLHFETFGEAFEELLSRGGLLSVGIFRELGGVSEGRARFMITNPPHNFLLLPADHVYCIIPCKVQT